MAWLVGAVVVVVHRFGGLGGSGRGEGWMRGLA